MAIHLIGLFHDPDSALEAAGKLKGAGFETPEILSPIPIHGVEEVLGKKKSVIKRFTLIGAITGGTTGFLLAAITAVMFPHPTGGRPIITIPPYLIITYELTILFGILATVLGFLISARLPAIKERLYVPEAAIDKFVVSVACSSGENISRASEIMRDLGVDEIRHVKEQSA
jgi:hypothetical protein